VAGDVARRKGLIEQILAERAKAKARREREERLAAQQAHRAWIAAERERVRAEAKAQRELTASRDAARKAEQRAKAQQSAAAEKGRRRREAEAQKASVAAEARQRRADAERAKEERLREQREQLDQATQSTQEIEERVRDLEEVLRSRPRTPLASPGVMEEVFNREGVEAFLSKLEGALLASPQPLGVPATVTVRAYRPEARELIVERQFPRVGIIPAELHYRVVSKALRVTMRKPAEIAKRYERLLASLTLRALDEVLNASPATLVDSVVFDGRVTAVDPATGKAVTPLLLSLQVERGAFEEILLDEPELDPCCA